MDVIVKQPNEQRNYGISFVNLITSTDTITAISTVSASPDGLTIGIPAVADDLRVEFSVAGGTDGTTYKIEALVINASGETVEGDGYLYVIDATDLISTVPTLFSSWGGGTSNSYVSLTNANSWITNNVFQYESWTSANYSRRSLALAEATRQIDSRQYIYDRKYSDQALEFPRGIQDQWYSSGSYSSDLTEMEQRMQFDVERACCLQALHLLDQSGYTSHSQLMQAGIKAVEKEVGPIRERFEYGNPFSTSSAVTMKGGVTNPLCEAALEYLRNWMTSRKIYRR